MKKSKEIVFLWRNLEFLRNSYSIIGKLQNSMLLYFCYKAGLANKVSNCNLDRSYQN